MSGRGALRKCVFIKIAAAAAAAVSPVYSIMKPADCVCPRSASLLPADRRLIIGYHVKSKCDIFAQMGSNTADLRSGLNSDPVLRPRSGPVSDTATTGTWCWLWGLSEVVGGLSDLNPGSEIRKSLLWNGASLEGANRGNSVGTGVSQEQNAFAQRLSPSLLQWKVWQLTVV